jgi:hypothetical protein
MLSFLVRHDVRLPARAVRLLVKGLVSDSLLTRQVSCSSISSIFIVNFFLRKVHFSSRTTLLYIAVVPVGTNVSAEATQAAARESRSEPLRNRRW